MVFENVYGKSQFKRILSYFNFLWDGCENYLYRTESVMFFERLNRESQIKIENQLAVMGTLLIVAVILSRITSRFRE